MNDSPRFEIGEAVIACPPHHCLGSGLPRIGKITAVFASPDPNVPQKRFDGYDVLLDCDLAPVRLWDDGEQLDRATRGLLCSAIDGLETTLSDIQPCLGSLRAHAIEKFPETFCSLLRTDE